MTMVPVGQDLCFKGLASWWMSLEMVRRVFRGLANMIQVLRLGKAGKYSITTIKSKPSQTGSQTHQSLNRLRLGLKLTTWLSNLQNQVATWSFRAVTRYPLHWDVREHTANGDLIEGNITSLLLNSEFLEEVAQFKYLGVTITSDLSWSKQVSSVVSKGRRIVSLTMLMYWCEWASNVVCKCEWASHLEFKYEWASHPECKCERGSHSECKCEWGSHSESKCKPHSGNDLCGCEWVSQGTPKSHSPALALAQPYRLSYTPGMLSP